MTTALVIGLPVIVIVAVALFLNLSFLKSFFIILVLAICSTIAVNFTFCSILKTQCEPDSLNAVGYFFHALYVVVISSVIYALLEHWFRKDPSSHDS